MMTLGVETEETPVRHGPRLVLADLLAVRTVGVSLAIVGLVSVVALVLMYVLEVGPGIEVDEHVFGPLSDVLSVTWNVLLIALVVAFRPAGVPWALLVGTVVACAAGALASMLLVVGVLPFAASTSVSVAALVVQSMWLLVLGRRLREIPGWVGVARLGRYIGKGVLVGLPVFAASLLFSWGSGPQVVIMVVAIIPGFAAWVGWPFWALAVGRHARNSGSSSPLAAIPLRD
jgi:hypothetical protein